MEMYRFLSLLTANFAVDVVEQRSIIPVKIHHLKFKIHLFHTKSNTKFIIFTKRSYFSWYFC